MRARARRSRRGTAVVDVDHWCVLPLEFLHMLFECPGARSSGLYPPGISTVEGFRQALFDCWAHEKQVHPRDPIFDLRDVDEQGRCLNFLGRRAISRPAARLLTVRRPAMPPAV